MRKRLTAIVLVFLVQGSLAWGQPAGAKQDIVLEAPGEPRPAPHEPEAADAHAKSKIFPFLKPEHPVADNAEDAAHMEEHHKPRIWAKAEYMTWWIRSANFPILVTTGDIADPSPGALNSLATIQLFGGNGQDFFDRKGGRFSAGWWFDDEQQWGFEGTYFFMTGRPINRGFISDIVPLMPVLANPFFNVNTGLQDSSLVAFPGIATGKVFIDAPSFLQGFEANLTGTLYHGEKLHVEALAGFRYLHLTEGLHIEATSVVGLAPQFVGLIPFADGTTIFVNDRFDTHNHFYGGQVGLRAETHVKRFTFGVLGKVALGTSHQVVDIRGTTTIDNTQPATVQNGGLYALSTNSGRYTKDTFAVVPEANFNVGFHLTESIRLSLGYTFLYWSNVARPGDQIDTNINPNFVPTSMTFGAGGAARPAFPFRSTDFFAHGINFGLEFRY